jgi:hypothetical protein
MTSLQRCLRPINKWPKLRADSSNNSKRSKISRSVSRD